MVRRRLSLPFTDVKEDDKVVADEEINNWKWKSYHEIDVKQNIGDGRYIHKIIQNNYNAKILREPRNLWSWVLSRISSGNLSAN